MDNKKREVGKFGLTIGTVLLILSNIPVLRGNYPRFYLLIPAIIFVLLALLNPGLLFPVYKWWMWLSRFLSKINSFIILTIVFFLVLVPIGLIVKIFSDIFEKFKFKLNKDSYWIKKNPDLKENMKRLF